jgi:hypothetical protein
MQDEQEDDFHNGGLIVYRYCYLPHFTTSMEAQKNNRILTTEC